jgi:hypothetical protein
VLGYENALAELDVDIELDVTPDTATLQQEQFQTLAELAKMYGPQEVPFDDMLGLSDLPDKRKLIEKRKTRAEQMQQQGGMAQQMQAQAASVEIADKAASAQLKQAQTEKTQAETAKLGVETQNEAIRPHVEATMRGAELGMKSAAGNTGASG